MMVPSIFNDNLFDSFFNDDFFWPETRRGADRADRKLYGHRAGEIMKTDVKETEKGYEVAIDLPGFKKEDVTCELKDGYLTVSAEKKLEENEKDSEGKYIRRERYTGNQSRSFYVGDGIHEDDIKASFQDGILRLDVPKQPVQQVEDKRHFVQISD